MEIIKQAMKTLPSNRLLKTSLCIVCSLAFAASSAWAAVVTWDLNPTDLNQSVGSASHTFTSSTYSITAYGFDVASGLDTPHTLFYKDSGGDHGLGLIDTPHNELQNNSGSPLQYLQFDFGSLAGFTNGQIKISSVDTGEGWTIYGSNTLGSLGTNLNLAGYGDSTNNQFVNIPNFGTYRYFSIVSTIDDVLPWSIRATIVPIPEAASLVPAICLIILASALEVRRRRRQTA
jgi:hypothetical protein